MDFEDLAMVERKGLKGFTPPTLREIVAKYLHCLAKNQHDPAK